MPVTGQHDVMFMPWMSHFINLGHFNLYAYLYEKFGSIVLERAGGVWAPYPYGFYLFTAAWLEVLEKLRLVDLSTWDSIWQVSYPARSVFLFKAAYLPFDLCIAYILYRTAGRLGLALWAWSPAAIYTSFMMGQNDIYATAFAVAGIYAASKAVWMRSEDYSVSHLLPEKWAALSVILLGIGSVFKIYPIFFIPPLALILGRAWRHRLILLVIGCSILSMASLPFLTTQTYVNSVLLNPEGTKIFREIQFFGFGVSPFLLGYMFLLGYLIFRPPPDRNPQITWFIALIVLALLFLWIPAPFYWLIWITPFLIGAISGTSKMLFAWVLLQLAFVLFLVNQHRELGVALPVHLGNAFNIPNIPTALILTRPVLYKIFITLLPVVNVILIASLLLIIWISIRTLLQTVPAELCNSNQLPTGTIVLPFALMLLILVANLFISRNLVSHPNLYSWKNQILSSGDTVTQKLSLDRREISGVRLRFTEATPSTTIKLCLYPAVANDQASPLCSLRDTGDQVEDKVLFFLFENKVLLDKDGTPIVKIDIPDSDGTIVLPYTTALKQSLQINDTTLNGSLDLATLSTFSIAAAFDNLVVRNILHDPLLLFSIAIVITLVVLFLAIVCSRPVPPLDERM